MLSFCAAYNLSRYERTDRTYGYTSYLGTHGSMVDI